MSIKLMAAVWEDEQLDQAETLTMLALADWANDQGKCWPSLKQLVRKTRLSERGLREIIKRLVEQEVLVKEDVAGKGTNYFVKPRHYVPPRHEMPLAPEAAKPARGAANTSITTNKTSRAKALSVRATAIEDQANGFKTDSISWVRNQMGWSYTDASIEFDRFVDNAKQHDRSYKDWRAAWRNWCRSPFCKTKSADDKVAYRKEGWHFP
jgi:hypothetical protein